MGYIRHHAIICTFSSAKECAEAHMKAEELYLKVFNEPGENNDPKDMVSPVIVSPINGYATIFIGPDGSKEGWEDSNRGDDFREQFVTYLKGLNYQPDWAEIMYYDEQADPRILNNG